MAGQNEQIEQAVAILRAGGLLGLPTETVYGLAADACHPEGLGKIFAAKGRPADHPVILHLAEGADLTDWACDISPAAWMLAKAFWPGPLTLILKKSARVPYAVTGGQDTVGIRVPDHALAQRVLKQFGSAVAAPSANRFGRISPTDAKAVYEELGEAVDLILDGGPCSLGIESTIVDCSGGVPQILRPGFISAEDIRSVLHTEILFREKAETRVSGSHEVHYAPATPAKLMSQAMLAEALKTCTENDFPLALMTTDHKNNPHRPGIVFKGMPADAAAYAHVLYQTLRELDQKNLHAIWIEDVPQNDEWRAVRDRLKRASAG